jgi:ABC-type uncharacterized transport system permease subunit
MDDLLLSALRLSIPLIFAALGGLLSERGGVANIALEGFILVAAFSAAAVTSLYSSLPLGLLAAAVVTFAFGGLFAAVCIWGKADQIVVGTAFNLMAMGCIPVACRALFSQTGSTPTLPLELRFSEPAYFAVVAFSVAGLLWYIIRSTRFGLRLRAAGDYPEALEAQGVSVPALRWWAISLGAVVVSAAGVYISLCQASGYSRNMAGGRGFIALAALIFGGWKPLPTLAACCFFGLMDALQIQVQNIVAVQANIPDQFIQVFPYIMTLLVLMFSSRSIRAPLAINRR